MFEQILVPRPEPEIKPVGVRFVEQRLRLSGQPDGSAAGIVSRRARLRGTFGRRTARRPSSEIFIRLWGFARRAERRIVARVIAQGGHATREFVVNLRKPVDALELIRRHAEAREDAREQKRDPQQQSSANGFENHG